MKTKCVLITHLLFCITVILFAGCDEKEEEYKDKLSFIGMKIESYELKMVVNYPYPPYDQFDYDKLWIKTSSPPLLRGTFYYKEFHFEIENREYLTELLDSWQLSVYQEPWEMMLVSLSGKFEERQSPNGNKTAIFIVESIILKEKL